MLYELIAVVRPGSLAEVKDIARTAGSLILQNGGTIRGITNWGVTALPKRTTKHQAVYHDGHHFVMRYDANSAVQDQVRKTLSLDPRMIKFGSVKLGDGKLDTLSRIGGSIPWSVRERRSIGPPSRALPWDAWNARSTAKETCSS
ncbi:hypothetical protein V495_06775 [Pseudogymnoascus sp. VKM F-4514 (FW-929)]|nr:hypothetical protein V490_08951 [Pseudogymnoascus sp. VKM F-3557]KFY38061.1 hypothetical protein V495_06775 [Pseudogymnoascus sp. VKM F-4514 (FW-929)]KFY62687.1 hypothetical protein V497_02277 [Pseudogymnoascus sp. VKM F-4516 (FW-969)]